MRESRLSYVIDLWDRVEEVLFPFPLVVPHAFPDRKVELTRVVSSSQNRRQQRSARGVPGDYGSRRPLPGRQ